jgi:uncharacterized membrane protein YecN with MAPEG domain
MQLDRVTASLVQDLDRSAQMLGAPNRQGAQGRPHWYVNLLGSVLVAARMAHAYGLTVGKLPFRAAGVIATFAVLVAAAVSLLFHA